MSDSKSPWSDIVGVFLRLHSTFHWNRTRIRARSMLPHLAHLSKIWYSKILDLKMTFWAKQGDAHYPELNTYVWGCSRTQLRIRHIWYHRNFYHQRVGVGDSMHARDMHSRQGEAWWCVPVNHSSTNDTHLYLCSDWVVISQWWHWENIHVCIPVARCATETT